MRGSDPCSIAMQDKEEKQRKNKEATHSRMFERASILKIDPRILEVCRSCRRLYVTAFPAGLILPLKPGLFSTQNCSGSHSWLTVVFDFLFASFRTVVALLGRVMINPELCSGAKAHF